MRHPVSKAISVAFGIATFSVALPGESGDPA
jgi:hypothetical protein